MTKVYLILRGLTITTQDFNDNNNNAKKTQMLSYNTESLTIYREKTTAPP